MFFHDFAGGADIAVTSTTLKKLPLTFNKLAAFFVPASQDFCKVVYSTHNNYIRNI